MADKLTFAGPEWLALAREVLQELVAKHGTPDARFSVCEVFTDAPAGTVGDSPGRAAWHFKIDGKRVEVGAGELDGADVRITADYQNTLPQARLVYTPEVIAAGGNVPSPDTKVEGDASDFPAYLVELHNRLAEATA